MVSSGEPLMTAGGGAGDPSLDPIGIVDLWWIPPPPPPSAFTARDLPSPPSDGPTPLSLLILEMRLRCDQGRPDDALQLGLATTANLLERVGAEPEAEVDLAQLAIATLFALLGRLSGDAQPESLAAGVWTLTFNMVGQPAPPRVEPSFAAASTAPGSFGHEFVTRGQGWIGSDRRRLAQLEAAARSTKAAGLYWPTCSRRRCHDLRRDAASCPPRTARVPDRDRDRDRSPDAVDYNPKLSCALGGSTSGRGRFSRARSPADN